MRICEEEDMTLEPKNSLLEDMKELPREHYTFQIDPKSVLPVEKKYIGRLVKMMLAFIACCTLLIVLCTFWYGRGMVGFSIGLLFMGIVVYTRMIVLHEAIFKKSRQRYATTVYDYTLYENALIVWISSDRLIRQMRIGLSEIRNLREIADFFVFEFDKQLFLLKKDVLAENSYFHAAMKKS